jgi:hypothetical protein
MKRVYQLIILLLTLSTSAACSGGGDGGGGGNNSQTSTSGVDGQFKMTWHSVYTIDPNEVIYITFYSNGTYNESDYYNNQLQWSQNGTYIMQAQDRIEFSTGTVLLYMVNQINYSSPNNILTMDLYTLPMMDHLCTLQKR